MTESKRIQVENLPVRHSKEEFLLQIVSQLSKTLEDVVGLEDAEGFISLVGARMGKLLDADYHAAANLKDNFDLDTVARVLVDLKHRIEGNFKIDSVSPNKIVLLNSRCPFGEKVIGKPSLCMMTSNVFGRIVADNLGYAKVELDETIAKSDGRCRIIIHLAYEQSESDSVREYFQDNTSGRQ
ncbi:methanogen output domain 1-containing protein [Rheinheimera gaetbuli]